MLFRKKEYVLKWFRVEGNPVEDFSKLFFPISKVDFILVSTGGDRFIALRGESEFDVKLCESGLSSAGFYLDYVLNFDFSIFSGERFSHVGLSYPSFPDSIPFIHSPFVAMFRRVNARNLLKKTFSMVNQRYRYIAVPIGEFWKRINVLQNYGVAYRYTILTPSASGRVKRKDLDKVFNFRELHKYEVSPFEAAMFLVKNAYRRR